METKAKRIYEVRKEPGRMDERVGRTHTPEIPVSSQDDRSMAVSDWEISQPQNYFVPGGQSTQLIVGATRKVIIQMVAVAWKRIYRYFWIKGVFLFGVYQGE